MDKTRSLDDLKGCSASILELPDCTDAHHELRIHSLLQRLTTITPHFAIVVQPSLRRRSPRPTWISRYNNLPNKLCYFRTTCSCQFSSHHTAHIPTYLACTNNWGVPGPCSEIPTSSPLKTTQLQSMQEICTHLSKALTNAVDTRTPIAATAVVGAQRTPDSSADTASGEQAAHKTVTFATRN